MCISRFCKQELHAGFVLIKRLTTIYNHLVSPPSLFGGFCFEFYYVNVPLFCFSVYLFVINVVLYTWNVGGDQNLTKTDIFNSVFFLWYAPLKLLYIQVLYVIHTSPCMLDVLVYVVQWPLRFSVLCLTLLFMCSYSLYMKFIR